MKKKLIAAICVIVFLCLLIVPGIFMNKKTEVYPLETGGQKKKNKIQKRNKMRRIVTQKKRILAMNFQKYIPK